jgi:hypothetical protein
MRRCDRLAAAAAKVPDKRPSCAMPFGGFACSSLDLFTGLFRDGLEISPSPPGHGVGEAYPGAIWPILAGTRLPTKTKRSGIAVRTRILEALGVIGLPASVTHDHVDAAICAVVAAAAAGAVDGLSVELVGESLYRGRGSVREGQMAVPVLTRALSKRLTRARAVPVSEGSRKRSRSPTLPATSGGPVDRAHSTPRPAPPVAQPPRTATPAPFGGGRESRTEARPAS